MTLASTTSLPDRPALRLATADDIAALTAIVGAQYAVGADRSDVQEPYLTEWRDKYRGTTPLVLRPASTDEVAQIVRYANAHRLALVPQGGNTGLVGGQIPFEGRGEIVVSLGRLNKIREIDPAGNTLTVEAGATLAAIQQAAATADRLFPLSLASEGTCQIGGNLATNAGGINVLAYGNTRDLCLGLEVVTAEGEIWDGLRRLRKDNTGYDLRDLYIGAEGTLGIITACVLKLSPRPVETITTLIAAPSVEHVGQFFDRATATIGSGLTAFEIIPRIGIDYVVTHMDGADPLGEPYPWYVLFDVAAMAGETGVAERVETLIAAGFEAGEIFDGVQAASSIQAQALWALRENLSEVQRFEGGSIKNDISVPVARIPEFITRANALVVELVPGARPVPFGHYGDGNIHYNISQPVGADKAAFLARWDEVAQAVNDLLGELRGSISAEHGIGRMKRRALAQTKSPVEIDLMRRIKTALDPNGIFNPGKVV